MSVLDLQIANHTLMGSSIPGLLACLPKLVMSITPCGGVKKVSRRSSWQQFDASTLSVKVGVQPMPKSLISLFSG